MEKLWIFGDSYSSTEFEDSSAWPHQLEKQYEVSNYSVAGSGPEYMMVKFRDRLIATKDLENISLMFFLSHDSRKPFSFLKKPGDQCNMQHFDKWNEYLRKTYAKQKPFLKQFYDDYYNSNFLDDFHHLKYVGIIKEVSRFFKKVLVIPVFDHPENGILYSRFNSTIEDTENFTYARGPALFTIEKEINTYASNHLCDENHKLMYEQLVNWMEHSIPFDTNNLKKL